MLAKLSKFVVLAVGLTACGGGSKSPPKNASLDTSIPAVDPTLCDTTGKNVVTFDLNHDNKPDEWILYKTEDEGGTKVEFMTCKQIDFDHDGRKDYVVAYNRKGNPIYEKDDFDFDGKWDDSKVFDPKTGQVMEVERASGFDGNFDIKDSYDTSGQLVASARDRNHDGKADMWEQYKDGVLIAILYDADFDGKVDRREEIPGAHPKVDMPTSMDPTASSNINEAGTGSGSGSAATPAAKNPPAPKK